MDTGLAGKKGLITAGSTGIGLGISRALAREGAHLVVASRDPDQQAVDDLNKLNNGHTTALSVDVRTESAVVDMVKKSSTN